MSDMPGWIRLFAVLTFVAIILGQVWPHVASYFELRRVTKNRRELAALGLRPEQYMATIEPTDYQSYAEAVGRFWSRRSPQERRDATLDRIGVAIGPRGAQDIRELKRMAHRLDNSL